MFQQSPTSTHPWELRRADWDECSLEGIVSNKIMPEKVVGGKNTSMASKTLDWNELG